MAKLTIATGVLLIAIGVAGFIYTGSKAPTALIPALIGLIVAVCGAVANTGDLKKRALWMHIAVTVGLLSCLMTIPGAITTFRIAHAGSIMSRAHAYAAVEKAATCLVSLLFVAFCVRNFIENRRARLLV